MKFIFLNSRLQISVFSSLSSLLGYGHCGLGSSAGAESALTWRPARLGQGGARAGLGQRGGRSEQGRSTV